MLRAASAAAAVPVSKREHGDVAKYRNALTKNRRVPFVAATLDSAGRVLGPDTTIFFIPARHGALVNEPRVLAGRLTVVGKVAYGYRLFPIRRVVSIAFDAAEAPKGTLLRMPTPLPDDK